MIRAVRSVSRSAVVQAQQHLRAASPWLSSVPEPVDPAVDRLLSSVRFKSTSKGSGGDGGGGGHGHDLFEKQMMELEHERTAMFGSEDENNSADGGGGGQEEPFDQYSTTTDSSTRDDNDTAHMYDERAALFAFTEEERKSWGAAAAGGGDDPHTHSTELMGAIHAAREAHFDVGDGEEETITTVEDEVSHSIVDEVGGTPEQHADFTHLTEKGDSVSMVDVGNKAVTRRVAKARSVVVFPPAVMAAFDLEGGNKQEIVGPKGPIFATAKIAGIMGAKRTSELIPLCHPLPLERVNIDITLKGNTAVVECECRVTHKTGVEMEALAGASIAALTIYDMVKAVSHEVRIEGTSLVTKRGGKRNVGEQRK